MTDDRSKWPNINIPDDSYVAYFTYKFDKSTGKVVGPPQTNVREFFDRSHSRQLAFTYFNDVDYSTSYLDFKDPAKEVETYSQNSTVYGNLCFTARPYSYPNVTRSI